VEGLNVQLRAFLLCVTLLAASVAIANDDPFPRLGGVNNGGAHNYDDAAYQADLAKLGVVMLGIWPGWDSGKRMTFEQSVQNIKKINPNTRVFLYMNSMEVSATDASAAPYYKKVDASNWWLTAPGVASKVLSEYGNQTKKAVYQINTTKFAPADADGLQEWEWHARWIIDQLYKPAPSIDGFFEDNVFFQPRISGDWNRDGLTDTTQAAGKWLREGYRARFALLHQLMPGKYVIGNIADWGTKSADLTELVGTLDGGIIEGILGASYSPETWGGWPEMLRWYRKTMNAIAEPKLVLFHMQGSSTDYQSLRYGLASCLMDDGYFAFTDTAIGYSGVQWLDEYDAKLGKALSTPPTASWKNGVYRRDFENGIALVNPKGNGAQDVSPEIGFKHLTGTQAPSVNDGTDVTTIHLLDRDGVILLRKPRPLPPTLKP
jgi:hypothetical protein